MISEQDYRELTEQKFHHLKDKKILIYGTGVIARRLIRNLSGFHLIGIIDRVHFSGELEGIPVLLWDEIEPKEADAIILASAQKNYRIIYQRIIEKCILYNIVIYGETGQYLNGYFGWKYSELDDARYFRKNKGELEELVSRYEAVSFDLFDTLIMRKTLEPSDVFDLVEDRIQEKGVCIPRFKVVRREAELQAAGGNIYKIYEILGKQAGLSEEQKQIVLDTELECEKGVLLPRRNVVEIFEYAKSLGKKISIISNMYLTREIIDGILKEMNIKGYDKIYVSCDCGVSKENGLFEVYLRDTNNMSCLHIGDNFMADVQAPLRYGIDSYGIKSALDMAKISNFAHILSWTNNCNEKGLLGLILADLFNNPFALYDTAGVVHIDNFEKLGKTFAGPLAVIYIFNLISHLRKNTDYEKVIFGARDGFIFFNIYNRIRENLKGKIDLPEAVYLLVSRKLCIRASMITAADIDRLIIHGNSKDPEATLKKMMGIPEEKVMPYSKKQYTEVIDYYMAHKNSIFEKSEMVRKRYIEYLKACGLILNQKYLFCDFISQGTIQYSLNQIFQKPLDGFFLCKYIGKKPFPIYSDSVYVDRSQGQSILFEKHCFLETIFSSPKASVEDMDNWAEPVFGDEMRTEEEIRNMCKEQKGIEAFLWDYYENLWVDGKKIKKELPEALVYLCDEVEYDLECSRVREIKLYNELSNDYRDTLRK